ncbi:MAG: sporulation protein YqfD [Clostridiales bacterium]|nr:sporulation protein YqfD [Clostridiales bacterium]
MIRLFRFLLGYVVFIFKDGFAEDFISDCFQNDVDIKELKSAQNGFEGICGIGTYKKLHRIALRHGGMVKIKEKHGLPFILKPLRGRMGFFAGIVVFIIMMSTLSGYVWRVEIVGCDRISQTAVITFLEKNDFEIGTSWNKADTDKLCWQMMSEFEDIAWVHINRFGTTAKIEINETTPQPDTADEDVLQGVTVFRKEIQTVAYREQSDLSIKKIKRYTSIHFFGIDISLNLNREIGDISEEETTYLNINDVDLPIGITTYTEKWLSSKPRILDDDELLSLANKKLEIEKEKSFDGYEIINESIDYRIDDDKCVITGAYIIRKNKSQ